MSSSYVINKWDSVEYDRRILPDILKFVTEYKRDFDGAFPTLRTIAKRFEIPSSSTASRFRDELVERGDLVPLEDDDGKIINYAINGWGWGRV